MHEAPHTLQTILPQCFLSCVAARRVTKRIIRKRLADMQREIEEAFLLVTHIIGKNFIRENESPSIQ